jgi:hypothetical protein
MLDHITVDGDEETVAPSSVLLNEVLVQLPALVLSLTQIRFEFVIDQDALHDLVFYAIYFVLIVTQREALRKLANYS